MSLAHPEIRLLDLTLAQRDKPAFIAQLRDMLINDGFVYLVQTPVPTEVIDKMVDSTAKFFALPADVKDTVDMNVSAHFNGYLGRGSAENPTREQFNYGDESVSHEEGTPEYHRIHGSTPWPDDALLPGRHAAMAEYYTHLKNLSLQFTGHAAEALGLAPDAFEPLFEADVSKRQRRCKILRYPTCPPSTTGFLPQTDSNLPHTDSNFLTYLLQPSNEPGLEIQKPSGEWFAALPIPGTFLVLVGRVLEKVTHRLLKAPMHRVVADARDAAWRWRRGLPMQSLNDRGKYGQRDFGAALTFDACSIDVLEDFKIEQSVVQRQSASMAPRHSRHYRQFRRLQRQSPSQLVVWREIGL
ncbi:hypothetical protein C8R44DRAFT_751579 [Mycena epipterygia]|nr:hypothetical protein C8R44DRAFT_751579 [Mycena epipterygia]